MRQFETLEPRRLLAMNIFQEDEQLRIEMDDSETGESVTIQCVGWREVTVEGHTYNDVIDVAVTGSPYADSITATGDAGWEISFGISTGDGSDTVSISATDTFAILIDLGAGADTWTGTAAAEDVRGGPGNDVMTGAGGDDTLRGGNDNDTIDGGGDADRIYGDDGNDSLSGGDGADHLHGGNHLDTLRGGANNDYMWGGSGNDQLYGDGGEDGLMGDDDDDTLTGGADADYLYGNAGADWLYASDGTADHWISGGDGYDTADTDSPLDDGIVQGDVEAFVA